MASPSEMVVDSRTCCTRERGEEEGEGEGEERGKKEGERMEERTRGQGEREGIAPTY
jgi:hypothetical protein